MSLSTQRLEAETFYIDAMALLYPSIPITGENADFNPPEQAPWVRISMGPADQVKTCIGSNDNYRTEGLIALQVFTPLSEGSLEESTLMDVTLKLFREATPNDLPSITILGSQITFSGQDEGFYQLNAFIEYRGEN